MGFEKLFEWLARVWELLIPFVVVDCYERGVVLRLGKYHRNLEPGLRWIIPVAEQAITETVVQNSHHTGPQSLTTSDGVSCVVSPVVTFTIKDAKKFLLDVEGRQSFLTDCVYAAVSHYVRGATWAELTDPEKLEELAKKVRRQGFKYGVEIRSLAFSDIVKARSLRLWNASM